MHLGIRTGAEHHPVLIGRPELDQWLQWRGVGRLSGAGSGTAAETRVLNAPPVFSEGLRVKGEGKHADIDRT
ncbi:MAG: hypothetical protein QNJ46_14280 [Leptolyngbyaceae cyanobacterium MO_188.B28]|nr:hypothetical protein [Leptolyngbyaceae cyanobacterium MO_188.B28]